MKNNTLLINGQEKQTISILDRGIQFGDGCFTTAAVFNGKIIMFDEHLERLRIACKRLHIIFLYWIQLANEMQQLANNQQRAILKVIITRGINTRSGYNKIHSTDPTRVVYVLPWTCCYSYWRKEGITLALSPVRLGRNPHLAGLKHLNRLEQVLISTYLSYSSANEALVLDSNGWIIECCTSNIFWRKNNIVYTPRLDQAGVNGIMRQFFIRMLKSSSFQVTEIYAREKALTEADEVVVCNTLMPVIPVRFYSTIQFSSEILFNFLLSLCKDIYLI